MPLDNHNDDFHEIMTIMNIRIIISVMKRHDNENDHGTHDHICRRSRRRRRRRRSSLFIAIIINNVIRMIIQNFATVPTPVLMSLILKVKTIPLSINPIITLALLNSTDPNNH